ncbi:mandelate racemase/muconate lactonizing enzyme family protein [Deinococcus roseus]|uniref:Chloromuconate cycloisomerase n=1 Tax=Deinococcus roseus TaxID=392414 RepID=A0ABQ2CTC0_9DEIO|nr:enolase C-terminal domain-like protein [Deinococcus roseus]GGJ19202.1 chloromuconate cycloisomerase [Deinococcus roseus]
MKIQNLELVLYRLPMKSALKWGAVSAMSTADAALVRITLEDGSTGEGEALARPTIYGETLHSFVGIFDLLKPRLIGMDIEDVDGLWKTVQSVANNHTIKGAIDSALWEARFRSRGQDLFAELQGPHKALKVSFILGITDLEGMLQEAREVHAAGVRVLKVKVGRDYQKDLQVIHALKAELPDMDLYADSNETLTPDAAPQILQAMGEAGLLWVEEPLPVHQTRARMELKKLGVLPIIADDSCFTLGQLERELDLDTFDILNIKPPRTGITGSLKMLELAKAAGKRVMIGSQAGNLTSMRHSALIASLEGVDCPSELTFFLKLGGDISGPNPVLQDGHLNLQDLAGLRPDPEKLQQYSIRL